MGYVLIAVSAVLSAVSYRCWISVLTSWVKRRHRSVDLADQFTAEWPGLAVLILPRPLRRPWNGLVLWVCVLLLGTPHHLVLWNFFRPERASATLYLHYLWTLAYWLALLGLPALVSASHRLSREQPMHGAPS